MGSFDHDVFGSFAGVMQGLFVRLLMFGATVFLGGYMSSLVRLPIPGGMMMFAVIASLFVVPALTIIAIGILMVTESNYLVCLALAINFVACYLAATVLPHVFVAVPIL